MTNTWPLVRLQDIFDLCKGKIGIKAATPGEYPLVTTAENHASHSEAHFSGDAICIPMVSATGHGHASIRRIHHIRGQFAAGSILCVCINQQPDRVDARFIHYFLNACKETVLIPLMQGSANVSLKLSDIAGVMVPVPTLKEQQAIVAKLDSLAEKCKRLEASLDSIESDANALTISLHHKLAAGRTVRLGDILELHEESTVISSEVDYPQVGVRGFGGGLFPKAAVSGSETTYRAFNKLYTNAIVLSQVKGWEGAIALCPSELSGMYVSPEYRTFRCKPDSAFAPYLGELIKTPWFWGLMQNATRGVGARRERTRPEQFLNIELSMPTYTGQETASAVLTRLTEMKGRHVAIREANAALVPAMLERIFESGRGDKLQK